MLATEIQRGHTACGKLLVESYEHAVQVGRHLNEAFKVCRSANMPFGKWVVSNCGMTAQHAGTYRRVARESKRIGQHYRLKSLAAAPTGDPEPTDMGDGEVAPDVVVEITLEEWEATPSRHNVLLLVQQRLIDLGRDEIVLMWPGAVEEDGYEVDEG